MQDDSAPHHCVFDYVYRDAGNWKTHGSVLLSGEARGVRDAIQACCEWGDLLSRSRSAFRRCVRSTGRTAVTGRPNLTTPIMSSSIFDQPATRRLPPWQLRAR